MIEEQFPGQLALFGSRWEITEGWPTVCPDWWQADPQGRWDDAGITWKDVDVKTTPLDLNGLPPEERELYEDEVCEQCGTSCTSSKECVELSGLHDDAEACGQEV